MKNPMRLALAVLVLAASALAPAMAQDIVGTLQVEGTVMTSNGGEFAPANDGQAVAAGERIMVAEGGRASVTLADGTVINYTTPGVYTVQLPAAAASGIATTTPVASPAAGVGTGAIVAAAAVAGAVIIGSGGGGGDNDAPPISR